MADHDTHDHTGVTGVPDLSTHTGDTSDAHDASAISVLDTATNFTGTDVEAVLAELQDNIDAVAGGGGYYTRRLMAGLTNADGTHNVNSTSYIAPGATVFYHDFDEMPATHFSIQAFAYANEGSQTVKLQLATQAAPATPYSAGGDDVTITNNAGAPTYYDSGWIAVSGSPTGRVRLCVAMKGSTTTVDWTGRWLDVSFKS